MKKTVWLLGASGLTGSHLGELLDDESDIFEVYAPLRTWTKKFKNLIEINVNFSNLNEIEALPNPEIVFCCIGTTIKKAGSEEAFLSIDYELVIQLAQIALKKGCLQFHLISSVGANTQSNVFYLRTKGQVESDLQKMGFSTTNIYRPSALLGKRNETRTGEKIGIGVSKIISPLFLGPLKKYKPIEAEAVGKVMLNLAKQSLQGFHIFESSEIQKMADSI